MEFSILGTVRVSSADGPVRLSNKQRALISALLLHPNTTLSMDRLITAIWDDPPTSAAANIQTYVSQLRRALRPTSLHLRTDGHGYRCDLPADQLDLMTFEALVRQARTARRHGDLDKAERDYATAVRLWRGSPAEDARLTGAMTPRVAELEEQLGAARSEWIDVRLVLGRENLVPELRALVAVHPLREQLWAQLMLALHRDGRRDEALDAFRKARTLLVAELGVEPGSELTRLHEALLAGDPPAPTEHEQGRPTICQLPGDVADFVGRADELATLLPLFSPRGDRSSPPIAVISGIPGVGKTTLAVHLAHRLRGDYPDAQLFVRANRDPADLLTELLRSLGVDGALITGSVEDRARLLRQRLADQAVLIVLDDADETGLRHLLPGTARSGVVVTSRARIPDLEGALQLVLEPPDDEDARLLLERVAGVERIRSAGAAVEAILRSCGRLPLAVRAAGARLATRPLWPVGEFASRLADRRLDELVVGGIDVRASFEPSYAALPDAARRGFRLLSLTGEGSARWSAAALLQLTELEADSVLETLVARGMLLSTEIDVAGQPRYRLHDLMRVYATERAVDEESEAARRAALRSQVAACLVRAREATRALPIAMAPPYPGGWSESPGVKESVTWLAAEQDTLVTAVRTAVRLGDTATAAELAHHLSRFLTMEGFLDEAERVQRVVIDATGDERTALRARLLLLHATTCRGRFAEAEREAGELLGELERVGDAHGAAYALLTRAACRHGEGDLAGALADARRAVPILTSYGDADGVSHAWTWPVWIHLDEGDYEEAARICLERLHVTRKDDHEARADLLRALGTARYLQGDAAQAVECYTESLRLWQPTGSRMAVGKVLRRLGEALGALDRFAEAAAALSEAARLFSSCGDELGRALAGHALATVRLRQGRAQEARAGLLAVLEQLGPDGPVLWRARALRDLGLAHASLGDAGSARTAWERSHELFGPSQEGDQVAAYLTRPPG
ncbi:BTAD domain-containing putative transcriptional regulator [Nonomuraea sp. NPDC050556]|uniref:AfsR/SARP family transcriptional regulator n=1 Tax=Nonomuraea sp. NPDC050556 TaxID=3364369 RepID=UPI0037943E79